MEHNNFIYASIIVCTYNQEKWIRQTIESLLSQETSYTYEIIIGEDGGTDGTRSICQEYADKYSNITLLPSRPNMGVTANWIRCIKAGTGKYIVGCAGDDYWHNPHKLQLQLDYMEKHKECVLSHTDYDILYENCNKISHNYNKSNHIIPPEGKIQQEILHGKEHISAVTMCFRRDVFETFVPTDKFIELKFPREDWPTLLILAAHGEIRYIPISTATYRVGQISISNEIDYEKIRFRAERDKVMTEYLYTLFPEWGPFEDGPYFDNIGFHNALHAAYRNNDYKAAREFAKNDKTNSWATRFARTKLTFKLFRWIKQNTQTHITMFKHTKRLMSDIRFWCQEMKLRRKEYAEWDKIESEAEGGVRHHMAGFGYYQTMQRNRAERKRRHEEERAGIK